MSIFWVFEMANNHQGSVDHAKLIVDEFAALTYRYKINASIKLQFRQLNTFIHKDFQDSDLKYVKRFNDTKLTKDQFSEILDYIKSKGLSTMVTPFDNESLDDIEELNVDIVKVASCSIDDWPLLREIADRFSNRVIISTAGADIETLDKVYQLFKSKNRDFAFNHCVGEYPTPNSDANLKRIDELKERYPDIEIGFSTHESPTARSIAPLAVAKGCTIIEKHVGVETDQIKLNGYSCNPSQMAFVIADVLETLDCINGEPKAEADALLNLKRGMYAKRNLKAGDIVKPEDVYFAMPRQDSQAHAAHYDQIIGHRASFDILKDEPVKLSACMTWDYMKKIDNIMSRTRAILECAKVVICDNDDIELSAHYGLDAFEDVGAVIISKVNREYCKKLIVQLPGQKHPVHHHVKKEEVFELLSGDCTLTLNGKDIKMELGRPYVITRGTDHGFRTETGCVIEEVSTTHIPGDSIYQDASILKKSLAERKIIITW